MISKASRSPLRALRNRFICTADGPRVDAPTYILTEPLSISYVYLLFFIKTLLSSMLKKDIGFFRWSRNIWKVVILSFSFCAPSPYTCIILHLSFLFGIQYACNNSLHWSCIVFCVSLSESSTSCFILIHSNSSFEHTFIDYLIRLLYFHRGNRSKQKPRVTITDFHDNQELPWTQSCSLSNLSFAAWHALLPQWAHASQLKAQVRALLLGSLLDSELFS